MSYDFEEIHKRPYYWYIHIDWEYLKEYHFNYDGDEEYKELTQKDYDEIIELIVDYYYSVEEDGDKIREIVESYGVFKAITLHNKMYDKKFEHIYVDDDNDDGDYENFKQLFLAILTAYMKKEWSLKEFNEIYKQNYDEYLESIKDDDDDKEEDNKEEDDKKEEKEIKYCYPDSESDIDPLTSDDEDE